MKTSTLITTLLATLAYASPISPTPTLPRALLSRDGAPQASDIIAAIMPSSTSCASASGQYASDCRTNVQAAQPLIDAMVAHNLTSAGQIAAVLALTGFESVDLRYKHNVSPGRPGQGTSAMLMPNFVLEYAQSIPELKGGVAQAGGDVGKVLDLVTDDRYNFGAAAWYLTSQCKAGNVVAALATASDAAWNAYMTCVGVGDVNDPTRLAYWDRAKKAFGLTSQ